MPGCCTKVENTAKQKVKSVSSQFTGQFPKVLPPPCAISCHHRGQQPLPFEGWVSHVPGKSSKSGREGWETTSGWQNRLFCQITKCMCTCFWLTWGRIHRLSLQVICSVAINAGGCHAGCLPSQQGNRHFYNMTHPELMLIFNLVKVSQALQVPISLHWLKGSLEQLALTQMAALLASAVRWDPATESFNLP